MSIKKKYVYVYLAICVIFGIFYVSLFVINRVGYAQRALDEKQEIARHNISEVVALNNFSLSKNLEYFIDYAQSLEHFYKKDKEVLRYLIKENSFYVFFGLLKNGKFEISNNPAFAKNILVHEFSGIHRIENMYIFNRESQKTYRITVYPIFIKNALDSHIIAYTDVTEILDSHNVYFASHDGRLLNRAGNEETLFHNISHEYPDEWSRIAFSQEGQFISDNGIFTYHSLNNVFTIGNLQVYTRRSYLVSIDAFEDKKNPYTITNIRAFFGHTDFTTNIAYWIIAAIWMFLTSIIVLFVVSSFLYKNDRAKYDNLTGAYNRMAGYEKIRKVIHDASNTSVLHRIMRRLTFLDRSVRSIHVCMMDIDELKHVNDTYGHKTGDKLITSITQIVASHLRRNEFIVRMGGDEFLIVFLNRNNQSIDAYWDSVYGDFADENSRIGSKYSLKVSHGVAKYESGENIESCIERADEQMYKEKRMRKVDLFFS